MGLEPMTTATQQQKDVKKYVITYFCILIIAALQFLIAYFNAGGADLWSQLLFLAIAEAILAILFFMHLWFENRGLLWSIVLVTVFVLITLQYSWTDSFRQLLGAPWSQWK